jgi:hypothetical protein
MDQNEPNQNDQTAKLPVPPEPNRQPAKPVLAPEIGGQKGPEPTRYGDWEKNGRCTDF